MKQLLARLRAKAIQVAAEVELQDIGAFLGLAAVCYGLAQIYTPAAWIVGGAALFWLSAVRSA